jgi:small subunit ribosomal protein S4
MGDPKRPRKTFSKPKSPWRSDQLAQELYLLGTYGLRNKRELWKAQGELSEIRKQARRLLAASEVVRNREERKLLGSLERRGLVTTGVVLDDVLGLSVEDMLGRRLQTILYKKGAAVSPLQARQLIVHRHVKINDRIVSIPGYHVTADEEGKIQLTGGIGTPKAPPPAAGSAASAAPAPGGEAAQPSPEQPPQEAAPAAPAAPTQ